MIRARRSPKLSREAHLDALLSYVKAQRIDQVALMATLMRESGIETMLGCGCRFGAWGYMACASHRGEHPRVCFCGQMAELVQRTAYCYRTGQQVSAEHWVKLRIAHWRECTGREWEP